MRNSDAARERGEWTQSRLFVDERRKRFRGGAGSLLDAHKVSAWTSGAKSSGLLSVRRFDAADVTVFVDDFGDIDISKASKVVAERVGLFTAEF